MKWEMEIEEVEAVLEKIWDLHDKLSDAIHSISRTHFLNSTKSLKNPAFFNNKSHFSDNNVGNTNGFVFVKDIDKDLSAVSEAKSLNSIRSALEHLEDQLEFFHVQQRAERDVAIARLEESRMILALKLAEHHGKKYKVIDEAINFVGDVRDASYFTGPENLSNPHPTAPTQHSMVPKGDNSNILVRVLLSGFGSAKKTLQLDKMGGVLGNAALFTLSMLALLHLHQVTDKGNNDNFNKSVKQARIGKKLSRLDGYLDVRLARG
ncbi:plastid division protein PDV1-like isoform X2 [Silene latifolia]|uniref:plastid division protein PDV1-like isoform X2 n=1 Tax=Silene latifolia TaxID=37657 RepID=UPI003D783872